MRLTKLITLSITIVIGLYLAEYKSGDYVPRDGYAISFKTGSAEGRFNGLKGQVKFDPTEIEGSMIDVSVDVNTIETGNSTKDSHAKGGKWFDATTYPNMTFVSTRFTKTGGKYEVQGSLTVKDVTKQVKIPFTYSTLSDNPFLEGVLFVNRKDYNINGNLFGFAVGKVVTVSLHVPAVYDKQ